MRLRTLTPPTCWLPVLALIGLAACEEPTGTEAEGVQPLNATVVRVDAPGLPLGIDDRGHVLLRNRDGFAVWAPDSKETAPVDFGLDRAYARFYTDHGYVVGTTEEDEGRWRIFRYSLYQPRAIEYLDPPDTTGSGLPWVPWGAGENGEVVASVDDVPLFWDAAGAARVLPRGDTPSNWNVHPQAIGPDQVIAGVAAWDGVHELLVWRDGVAHRYPHPAGLPGVFVWDVGPQGRVLLEATNVRPDGPDNPRTWTYIHDGTGYRKTPFYTHLLRNDGSLVGCADKDETNPGGPCDTVVVLTPDGTRLVERLRPLYGADDFMRVTVQDTNRFGDLLVTVLTSEWGGYDTWVLRLDHARTGEVSPP